MHLRTVALAAIVNLSLVSCVRTGPIYGVRPMVCDLPMTLHADAEGRVGPSAGSARILVNEHDVTVHAHADEHHAIRDLWITLREPDTGKKRNAVLYESAEAELRIPYPVPHRTSACGRTFTLDVAFVLVERSNDELSSGGFSFRFTGPCRDNEKPTN